MKPRTFYIYARAAEFIPGGSLVEIHTDKKTGERTLHKAMPRCGNCGEINHRNGSAYCSEACIYQKYNNSKK